MMIFFSTLLLAEEANHGIIQLLIAFSVNDSMKRIQPPNEDVFDLQQKRFSAEKRHYFVARNKREHSQTALKIRFPN